MKNYVSTNGEESRCNYCGKTRRTISVADLAHIVERAFAHFYIRTTVSPYGSPVEPLGDEDQTFGWTREGEPVLDAIAQAGGLAIEVAEDVRQVLENHYAKPETIVVGLEGEFDSRSYYMEKNASGAEWEAEWRIFVASLTTETRFFNRFASQHLTSLFEGLETLQTREGRRLIVNAGPSEILSSFYRARVFQSEALLLEALKRPDLHLGPPPYAMAVAGRMNASGIAVFYGATDASTAVAEVRPPVGSDVAVAEFEVIRTLRLLDLTALDNVSVPGSIFDASYIEYAKRVTFLRSLSKRITQPVMPDDEALDYLPTQAVADFLASEVDPAIDGIVYPSVQTIGFGSNVVLFHNAARVMKMMIPAGSDLRASSGDWEPHGFEFDYQVVEGHPSDENSLDELTNAGLTVVEGSSPGDPRDEPTLLVNLDNVAVHIVERAQFETTPFRVKRYIMGKPEMTRGMMPKTGRPA